MRLRRTCADCSPDRAGLYAAPALRCPEPSVAGADDQTSRARATTTRRCRVIQTAPPVLRHSKERQVPRGAQAISARCSAGKDRYRRDSALRDVDVLDVVLRGGSRRTTLNIWGNVGPRLDRFHSRPGLAGVLILLGHLFCEAVLDDCGAARRYRRAEWRGQFAHDGRA